MEVTRWNNKTWKNVEKDRVIFVYVTKFAAMTSGQRNKSVVHPEQRYGYMPCPLYDTGEIQIIFNEHLYQLTPSIVRIFKSSSLINSKVGGKLCGDPNYSDNRNSSSASSFLDVRFIIRNEIQQVYVTPSFEEKQVQEEFAIRSRLIKSPPLKPNDSETKWSRWAKRFRPSERSITVLNLAR
ncbi:hypothetical protein V1478_006194 [Vespula squamosa]|uniref:Uncharacterized protein n=1 Tax=Vespula squamosa TaxID=30214 RepID=A0ABD2B752_VESSQ